MSLTEDHVERAIAALESGQMPDDQARLHLIATWQRWRAGLPFEQAIGLAGPLAIRQRNAALLAAAAHMVDDSTDGRPWVIAKRLYALLCRARDRGAGALHPPLAEALRDCLRAGNGHVPKADSIYRILRCMKSDCGM